MRAEVMEYLRRHVSEPVPVETASLAACEVTLAG